MKTEGSFFGYAWRGWIDRVLWKGLLAKAVPFTLRCRLQYNIRKSNGVHDCKHLGVMWWCLGG